MFGGESAGVLGIYVVRPGGEIEPLVVAGDVTENGETIASAGSPSGDGSLLAFRATTTESSGTAIFVRTRDGTLRRLVGEGDTLDGRPVHTVLAAADHATVAIRISSRTGAENTAIYRAYLGNAIDVPTLSAPGVVALVALLAVLSLLRLRRTPIGLDPETQVSTDVETAGPIPGLARVAVGPGRGNGPWLPVRGRLQPDHRRPSDREALTRPE